MSEKYMRVFKAETVFNGFKLIKDNEGNFYNGNDIVTLLNKLHNENTNLKTGLQDNNLPYIRDELRGYFGALKLDAKNLSEQAIVEKIQNDLKDIINEIYEE